MEEMYIGLKVLTENKHNQQPNELLNMIFSFQCWII